MRGLRVLGFVLGVEEKEFWVLGCGFVFFDKRFKDVGDGCFCWEEVEGVVV